MTFLVLALTFLVASFLARNSDLWFHLATGRLLAQGQFSFGADPFSYTTGQVYWANHAWLFDLGLYGLYGLVGGTGLIVLKALLVTALAGLLLRLRRPSGSIWLPAACTTLAVLAMSPHLHVQPVCVSYLFLGLTLWFLERQQRQVAAWESERVGAQQLNSGFHFLRSYWPLLLLFALWVNVDEWFLLGPMMAALFWFGEWLEGRRQTSGWVVPAGLAVCLLNPHTFHAFTLPPELSAVTWTSGLRQDVRFQALFGSPWQSGSLHAAAELSAPALAYFALTFLGLVGFFLYRPALRSWRLAVWLPFAALAAWQAQAIPFFAVVAAPITVLNWQDFLAQKRYLWGTFSTCHSLLASKSRHVENVPHGYLFWAGRLILVLALLGLIFLSWPGWLAGYGREGRHVAWGVQVNPSLQRVAETLHHWQRQGLLPAGERVFALSPEVAQHGAWFCPGEKHFFDHRYQLFPGVAQDYEIVCRALDPALESAQPQRDKKDWRQVLREHGVGIVVFHDREPQRLFAVLRRLAADREHWTLLHVAGQALIAGWNEARPPGAFTPMAFDADRLAFGLQDERAQRELPAAPEQGPDHLPSRRDFWNRVARPPAPASWESTAATVYLHYFEDSLPWQRQLQLQSCLRSYAASLAGLPALPAGVSQVALQVVSSHNLLCPRDASPTFLVRDQLGPFFAQLVEQSPALPLLAVRAARRAVAANPEDSNAWLRLGQAYLLLRNLTCERSAERLLPPLTELRHVQIVTALEEAVRLDPDLETVHHELAYLYGERNFLDQALEHRREEIRLSLRAGRRPGETAEALADRLELLEKETAKLEKRVQERRNAYAAGSPTLQGVRLQQAELALRLGLARQAFEEILWRSPADVLGLSGIKLELELLLSLGRAEEVRPILNDEVVTTRRDRLTFHDIPAPHRLDGTALYPVPYHWPAYEWLRVLQAARVGDYGQARAAVRAIRSGLQAEQERLKQQLRRLGQGAGRLLPGLLAGPPPFLPAFTAGALNRIHEQMTALSAQELIMPAHQADLCVLEGLLALEQGHTEEARSAFEEAQRVSASFPFAGKPIAAGYLQKGVGNQRTW